MKKFLSLHSPNGKELKIRADVIFGLQSVDAEAPNGARTIVTLILTIHAQIPCKESIEKIEALLAEPDFSA